jgi:DMSO reductase anchor subunit
MCKGRLEDGLEPACANACPEAAIEIEIVNMAEWRANFSAAESPGMPTAAHTISTTRITVPQTGVPLERVDAGKLRPEHAHRSLVFMTTMMQAVTGALAFLSIRTAPTAFALATLLSITAIALAASTMHLGRPAYAWRALRMWRRSWLSREVLLFTLFFGSLTTATLMALPSSPISAAPFGVLSISRATCLLGLLATVASALIYLVPARPSWNTTHTPVDFVLTAAMLGAALASCFHAVPLAFAAVTAITWTGNHSVRLYRLCKSATFEQRASYSLLTGNHLLPYSLLALLAVTLGLLALTTGHPILGVLFTWTATLLARYLFFVSVVPLKMALTFIGGGAA